MPGCDLGAEAVEVSDRLKQDFTHPRQLGWVGDEGVDLVKRFLDVLAIRLDVIADDSHRCARDSTSLVEELEPRRSEEHREVFCEKYV